MTTKPVLHIGTSHEDEQRLPAWLIQTQMGGKIVHVAQRPDGYSPPGTEYYRPEEIEDAHIAAASVARAVLDVDYDSWPAFIEFLKSCPGTAADYQMCVISTTPDRYSQRSGIEMADAVVTAGLAPGQLYFIRIADRGQAADSAFPLITKFHEQHALHEGRVPEILHDADVLLQSLRDGVELGVLLHTRTDFEPRLDEARRAQANNAPLDVRLSVLMRKVLLQRKLVGVRRRIAGVLNPLGLPHITPEEWFEEASRFGAASSRGPLSALDDGANPADLNPVAPQAV
jgi:hypothetical protein